MLLRRLLLLALLAAPCAARAQVRPADLSRLSPSDFRDDELDLPYYLAHFHRIANSVALTGPRRGFIDISVWRNAEDNQPYNARIMESILSLAYFYTLDRPWNPYRGDPELRVRLEAALDFWANSQNADGRFSEYAVGQWSLAPTAFATKFMGESIRLLRAGPPIDTAILRRAIAADRKALMVVFTRRDMRDAGLRFTNQYSNTFAGALAYLAMFPDPELAANLREQLAVASREHQSPVGFFYEMGGPDWGYNLDTHHSNFIMAYHYTRGTPLAAEFVEPMARWYEWFAYNALPEPGRRALTLNRGIETRQRTATVTDAGPGESATGNPLSEVVPAARVLGPTTEELARRYAARRAALVRSWPRVDSMPVGTFRAFSPYVFLHRSHVRWYPDEAQWNEARANMRPVRDERFTHQRVDSRAPSVFTFVRRAPYYATFASGDMVTPQQRFGLGLVWTPAGGTFMQSQSAGTTTAWGTRRADTNTVYEARTFNAAYAAGDTEVSITPGARDLPSGALTVTYPLAAAGRKTVRFGESGVEVTVQHAGAFVEQVPLLLLPSDSLSIDATSAVLHRGALAFTVRWSPGATGAVHRSDERIGDRVVTVLSLSATSTLSYEIRP